MAFNLKVLCAADGRWTAEVLELPRLFASGRTRAEAVARAQAIALRVLAFRLEAGEAAAAELCVSITAA